jgi:4-aminobutyrate aminotransferase-like enzyme
MWVETVSGKKSLIADSDLGVSALGYKHPKLIEFRKQNPELFDFCDAPVGIM